MIGFTRPFLLQVGNVTRKVDNGHYFTSTIGHLVYVVFHVIGIITLVNMLIAMMSNSYAQVEVRSHIGIITLINMLIAMMSNSYAQIEVRSHIGIIIFINMLIALISDFEVRSRR